MAGYFVPGLTGAQCPGADNRKPFSVPYTQAGAAPPRDSTSLRQVLHAPTAHSQLGIVEDSGKQSPVSQGGTLRCGVRK